MNSCFEAKCGEVNSWGEELVFENFLSVEFILSQFFTEFEFSCVFLTDQIFMIFLFHLASEDPKHDPVNNPSMESRRQTN